MTTNIIELHGDSTQYGAVYAAHLEDGVHPNSIMYTFIGQFLFNSLKNIGIISA